MLRSRLAVSLLAAGACAALGAAPAAAATRYAAADSTDAAGACASQQTACAVEHAIEGAAANDEVVVLPGTYDIGASSIAPPQPITVRGVDAANRPTIVGSPLTGSVLEVTGGGTLRDLRVESHSAATAITIQGGTGERVIGIVSGGGGDAKGIQLKNSTNVLRDSLALSDAPTGAGLQIKDGTNTAIGVTAVGTGGAAGLDTKIISGTGVVKNSILLGAHDSETAQGASPSISYSNWRAANSIGGTDAGSNQMWEPKFCTTRGLYYPAAGSPTIDAGGADVAAGTIDVDGASRSLGGGSDIGAWEYSDGGCPPAPRSGGGSGSGDGSGTTTGTAGGGSVLPPTGQPVLGSSVTLGQVKGSARVRLAGSNTFVPLTADSTVPVGAVVDATKGTVELTSVRDASGQTQTGTFWGGVFEVRQSRRDTVTELALTGGNFSGCRSGRRGKLAAAGSRRTRLLWGRDRGGRFRTRGRHGSATVRGTRWLTEDRCDGTYFKVAQGAIDVRDDGRRKTVRLKRGQSYLAAAAKRRKR